MTSDEHLRLKRHYSVIAHSPDEVELRYGVWNPVSLQLSDDARSGKLFKVVSRLDGSVSPARIAKEENVPRDEVDGVVDCLLGLGVLETEPETALDHYLDQATPWRRVDGERPSRPVRLLGDPALTAELERLLARSLPGAAISRIDDGDPALAALGDEGWLADALTFQERLGDFDGWRDSFVVAAFTLIDPLALRIVNRVCLELDVPWLHAALDGPFVFVGPIVVPGNSACYECLETRVLTNLRESASYQRYKAALAEQRVQRGAIPLEPALAALLSVHAALEAINFLLTGHSFTVGKVLAIYLPTMEVVYNDVLRAPTCPACAPLPERDDTELYFDMEVLADRPT